MNRSDQLIQRIITSVEDLPGERPLNERLVQGIKDLIFRGELIPSTRLPSSRDLALGLGWHRSTVVQAYRKLVAAGWADSGVGRGTFVKQQQESATPLREPFTWAEVIRQDEGLYEMERVLSRNVALPDGASPIRLSGAIPDLRLFPMEDLAEVLNETLRLRGPQALGYGPTEGLTMLREEIAGRLSRQGTPARADQILIVQGSQQGLDLVVRRIVRPGECVAVESPTYSQALALFRNLGVRLAPIPLDEEGLRVDILETVAAREKIRLIYTMPTFQNPTGLTQSVERRRALLDLAARKGIPILEDHFDAELRYEGEPVPTLKALDTRNQVILLGTFSKILFPGLRVGWVAAPEPVYDSLSRLMRAVAISTSLLSQIVMAEFCAQGLLDRHLDRVISIYAQRRKALLDGMNEYFPPEAGWTNPQGGMTLWVTLPPGLNSVAVTMEARRRGVSVAPGPLFFVEGGHRNLSLSSTAEPSDRLKQGIRILGDILYEGAAGEKGWSGKKSEAGPLL
ncbi:MAG: PLP-dependent aminotransferase family protein [Candidatus Eisenbacteria bacterium]|uniref:PLP-dependent aminotransferase family protein n=1 Tax=Eiseniibacteriota bacterium TaxID=2212470 RepID=A0A948W8N4_UNCEI|nr:PLP-dependent aminotransferase family protein [Candidatus Eisenbacteria bacterium]MBU1950887.1 PLP-dependent aminotransferase family protein [Candidatus Eisenbacteria bacterium]MBU2692861.1 PLP-dependent aminotransferase family protein [Candidatus Eisenbacteria bacterium]